MSWLAELIALVLKSLLPWLFKEAQTAIGEKIDQDAQKSKLEAAKKLFETVMADPNSTEEQKRDAYQNMVNAISS